MNDSNLNHLKVGFIASFVASILVLIMDSPSFPRVWMGAMAIVNFFWATVVFESYQHIKSNKPTKEYFTKPKIKDTILDIVFANAPFIMVMVVLGMLGEYAGNILR